MERKRNAQLYLVLRGVIAVLTAAGIWNEVTIMSTNLLVSMKNLNKPNNLKLGIESLQH